MLTFVLGVVGVILPVMPGWPFFLVSAALFFPRHRLVYPLLEKGESRLPRFVGLLRRLGVGHQLQPEPVTQRIDPTL